MLLGVRGAGKARLKRVMHSAPCVVRFIIWFAKRRPCIGIVGFRRKNVPQLHALSLQRVIFVGSLGPLGARYLLTCVHPLHLVALLRVQHVLMLGVAIFETRLSPRAPFLQARLTWSQMSVVCAVKCMPLPVASISPLMSLNSCRSCNSCQSQAGFRWGAEEQIYTLVETLRLRARKRTFCTFVDVRKAFDVAWKDAVRVQLAAIGVTGSTWRVLDDLLGATSARVLVNGTLSEPWDERAGVRQGSVLGPLLFNILFDGISAAVRAACPGVPLGRGPRAPRVTLLLYADDLVVLADSESGLQRALDAIGAWGARWRFSFGIGPDKTAVLAVGCRSRDFRFVFQGSVVPVVPEYRYLDVIFQASKRWNKQTDRLISKSTRKFHQCIAWAESRGLHTSFRRSLFQSYVLPSMTHGAAFLDDTSVRRLDKHVRQLGRRLLCWPAGTPNAAVLGELGWDPFAVQVLRGQAGLLGRLPWWHAPWSCCSGLSLRCWRAKFLGSWSFSSLEFGRRDVAS